MSKTTIEWCIKPGTKPETWNPTTGCNKVSQGCKNCYAEVMHKRLMGMFPKKYSQPFLDGAIAHEDTLSIPFKWKTPRTVFVNSMSDLFHDDISFAFIYNVWQVMEKHPQHTFIILTKRPDNLLKFMFHVGQKKALPNVWLGVSCENQETANERIPILLKVPAVVKFLSCEPLLGKILLQADWVVGKNAISWVIVGGESGHHARPMHPDWVRSLKTQCKVTPMPFFFKQWGEWLPLDHIEFKKLLTCKNKKEVGVGHFTNTMYKVGKKQSGNLLDGKLYQEFPNTKN